MGNVDICHNKIVVTNNSYSDISGSCAVNGNKFPDSIEVADNYTGLFSAKFQILGRSTDGTKLEDMTAFTNMGVIVNYCVRADYCIFPDFNIISNYRIRTNFNAFGQLGIRRNN